MLAKRTFISKYYRLAQSRHSRAARRDVSPSVDVDKSLRSAPRAESTVIQRESVLSERANSGVTKKQPKAKALSKAQRQRQQKGMEKAEMVVDQLEKKVDRSLTRGKSVKARRVCVAVDTPWGTGTKNGKTLTDVF